MRSIVFWLAMLAVLWTPPAEGGGMFRWLGEDGTVHFADTPGHPQAERFVPGRRMSVVDTVATPKRPVGGALAAEIRWQKEGHREAAQAFARETARRDSHCASLKKQLAGVEGRRADGKGSDRRRVRIRELEDRLFSECK